MPKLGAIEAYSGNVTTLIWIGPRSAADIEERLGYGAGRLSKGYWIVVLKQRLTPADFEFEGTTLNSGGRLGLPGASDAADAARRKMHDKIMGEYGKTGYTKLQEHALRGIEYSGTNRIAKVLPVTPHDGRLSPALQYPMGGGGLQWRLKTKVDFLVACFVDDKLVAETPLFTVDLAEPHGSRRYENRAKLMNYLATA